MNSSFERKPQQNPRAKMKSKARRTNFNNINVQDLLHDKGLNRHIGGSAALTHCYSFDQIPNTTASGGRAMSTNSARQIFPGVTLLKGSGSFNEYAG